MRIRGASGVINRRAWTNAGTAVLSQFNASDLVLLLLIPAFALTKSPLSAGLATIGVVAAWTALDYAVKRQQARRLGIPSKFWHLARAYAGRRTKFALGCIVLGSGLLGAAFKTAAEGPFLLFLGSIVFLGVVSGRRESFRLLDEQRVLVLRRFGPDSLRFLGRIVTPVTWHLGICITLTEPGIKLPRIWRRRIGWVQHAQVDLRHWQERVLRELRIARVVIIDVSEETPALTWELQAALREHPLKTLLIARNGDEASWVPSSYQGEIVEYGELDDNHFRIRLARGIIQVLDRTEGGSLTGG